MGHPSLQLPANEGSVLAPAVQGARLQQPDRVRVEHADIGRHTGAEMAAVQPQNPRRTPGQAFDYHQQRQYVKETRAEFVEVWPSVRDPKWRRWLKGKG